MTNLRKSRIWLGVILAASFVLRLVYLFGFSAYKGHLESDMVFYWMQALRRLEGDSTWLYQWTSCPPAMHYFLCELLRAGDLLGFAKYRLEFVLVFFCFLSVSSVAAVYWIARHISKNVKLALGASALYAFCFPILYLNTFVLGENFVVPFLAWATCAVMVSRRKRGFLAAGLLLGAAAAVRPNLLLLAAPFLAYVYFRDAAGRRGAARTAVFFAAFAFVVLGVTAENARISKGVLKGLSPNGGHCFFLQQYKPCYATSTYYARDFRKPQHKGSGVYRREAGFSFSHPAFHSRPENGVYTTDRPWHEQDYFYRLGFERLKEKPSELIENFKLMGSLFWGPFFPSHYRLKTYDALMPVFNWVTFLCTLPLPLIFWVGVRRRAKLKALLLLLSVPVLTLAPTWLFTVEQRYVVPSLFAVYIAFFCLLPEFKVHFRKVLAWAALTAVLFGYGEVWRNLREASLAERFGTKHVRVLRLKDYEKPKEEGKDWNAWGNLILYPAKNPVLLESRRLISASSFEISTDANDVYRMTFYRGEEELGTLEVPPFDGASGLRTLRLPMPEAMKGKAFDAVLIRVQRNDGECSVGHLIFR